MATVSDTVDEANGDVTVTVGTGTGYTVGSPSSASVTVNDDDAPAATIKAGTSPVTEGTAASFTVELSTPAPTGGLTIALTVADASGSDFIASTNEGSKTLAFNAGDTSKTYAVATVADTVDEANGDVKVTVGTGTGYTVGSPSSATVTVNDDDAPAATIKAGTSPVTEGTAASFTVELSTAAPTGGLSIALTVADASGSDFVASTNEGSKTLAFNAGDTAKTYTVATIADTVDEANGDIQVTVGSGTGYTVGSPSSASVTVNDDDAPAATITAGTSPVTEGTAATFTVTLSSAAPGGGLTIALTVADASGSDFVASSNEGSKTLAFAQGDTSKTYSVATVSDTVDEASGAVTVTVGSATGYTVGSPSSASVTVNDDDATVVSAASVSVAENAGNAELTLSLTRVSGDKTEIRGTVTPTAGTAGASDYTGTAVSFTIAGSSSSTTVSIPITDDSLIEGNERFTGAIAITSPAAGYAAGAAPTITITDDDAGVVALSLASSSVTEGGSFTANVTLQNSSGQDVTLSSDLAVTVTPEFAAAAAGKAAASDMTDSAAKTLTIKAGASKASATFSTAQDQVDEPDEAFSFKLTSGTLPSGVTLGTTSADATIIDDDAPAATIRAGTSPVTEGTGAEFTVTLSTPAPTGGLTIALTVADAPGSDFVASSNEGSKTLAFNAGDTSKTYSVATVADTVDEANGDVTVTVGTGTGYTVGTPSSASVTVSDDDAPAATIKAGTSPVTEGTAASFTVELSSPAPTGGLSIALTVADASGSDFIASTNEGSKTLAFNAGDTSKTYSVATVADTVDEANGAVKVTVGSGTGYTVGSPSSASVTVNDDDAPAATITAGTSPVTEGTAASFTVELSSAAPTGGLTIALTVADASGSDFVASTNEGSKTLAFNAGDTSKTYSVATVSDTIDEANGDVTVTVGSGSGYTVGSPSSASVTVNDDDNPATTIKADTSPVTEGTAASFTVELSTAAPTGGLSIALTVADASGSDFVASTNEGSKTLAFNAGDTSKTYSVATVADTVDEANGDVTVTVGTGTGYTVGTPSSAKVTVNDDDAPAATIKAGTSPVTEGTAASFTVTLSTPAPTGGLTIALTVADASGSDFVASTNEGAKTLAFNAGDTSKTYTVATVSDTVDEANGDVKVTVGTGTGYTVGTPSSAKVTVNDDDAPAATIKAGTSPVTEGTAASFTVELSSAAPEGGLSIALTVADASGSDFIASANEGAKTLAFNAGDTSKTYSVATVADTVDEANGDVTVTVGSGTGYTVGSPSSASVTVNDDDAPAATIKAGTSPVTEGTSASFTVTLSTAAPDGGLSIALTVADASGSDFVTSTNEGSKTLAFNAGDTSKTYSVATVSDTVDEANGDVTVTVGTGTGYTVGTPSSAKVTVNDDDAPAATIKAGTSPVTEGTAASFTVELSTAAPTGGLTIALTVADASGSDFVASSNEGSKTLAFNAGDTSKIYSVATVSDTVDEANGDVTVTVGTGTGYTVGSPSSASVTVNDDDAPAATIKAGTSPVTEGTAASFTVTLSSAAPTGGLSIALTVADASGSDFVAASNEGAKTLAFNAGDTSKTYSVATVADTVDEANGDVKVTVGTGTGYTVGSPSSASVTVNDDDAPAATIKAGTSPVTEGTAASFTVELSSAAPTGGLTIALTVADASGSDFVASTNEGAKTLAFDAGDTSKTYSVATVADTVDEANGAVKVTVDTGTGYTVGSPSSASVTVNDDDAPAATITAGTSPVTEGTAASFTVELSTAAPTGGLSIALTVADASGSDFVASTNEGAKTLAFNAGDTSKTYTVATVADTQDEANGDVTVTVGTGTGYTVGTPSSAKVTVNDDDAPAATIKAGTSPVTEGTAASFTVELSTPAPSGGLSIALTVADASSSDFVASTNEGAKTLAFNAGDTSKTYSVATVADTVDEANGDVKVTVGSGTGYTVGSPSSASVTVNDDDAPAATIKAGTSPVTEGTAASFTVELSSAAPTGGLTIALTVADASGSDFVASSNEGSKTLAFNAGDTSKTYSVATVADTVDEANGDVKVTVGTGTGYTVGTPSSAKVTVNDDDAPAATIKAGTSPVTEGTAATFTVELSTAAPTGGLSIALTVADASGSDFVASSNEGAKTLAFNAGDTSKTYTVATVADSVDEANGAVKVTVGSGTGYSVGSPSSASVTVNDDDAPAATITAGTSPVTEGTAATFTVELSSAAPTGGLTIALTVADATGSDFVASSNEGAKTLAFNAGDTSKTYTVATVADSVDEADGDVQVTVGSGTGYTVGTPSSAKVTVNDDDAPAATIKAGTSPVTEGTAASFTVELSSAAPTGGLTIALTVADASGSDFIASANEGSKTLAFDAGDTSKTYSVATVSDTVDEANGDVTVTVGTGTGYTVGTPSSASVTVNDDDAPAATIKAGTSPVTEGTAASFTVELSSAAPTGGLTIALTVADASGSDFVASTDEGAKTLAFNAGDTSKTYSVATVSDTQDEANGDVTVTVGSGTGYTVGSPSSAKVTVNDDDAPAATITAGTSPVTEGTAATFTVALSNAAPTGGLSIALTVADASGSDFVASSNEGSKTLAFNAGDTSKTYSVATVSDTVDEANGDVKVTVGSGTGYTVGSPSSAKVTVNDDDAPAATIKAGTSPVTEGTAASFTVELSSAAPTGGLTIALTVADASGSDFVASANEGAKTLAFDAGDTSKTYSVATVADTVDEANGDVTVTVGTGTGYTVGTPSSAKVTVNDDDAPAATIKAGTSPVTEGTAASFTVELSSAAPEGGLSIALTVADASGSDFVASANEGAKTLAFDAGDTSKTYSVATVSDTVDEANGGVKVTVGTGTGYTVGTPSSAKVTVNDDDAPAATIKAGTSPVTEGTAASFTVELSSAAPTGGLSIALTVADASGSDFVASTNEGAKTLAFDAGDTSKTYTVATVADTVDEANGAVKVTVGTGTGYTVGSPSSASVTVNDDDAPAATITAGTSPVTEGTAATFTVALSSAAPTGGLSIALTVADASGSDFVASSNEGSKTLAFNAGDTSKTYSVATVADAVDEASGDVTVTVGSGTGYTVGTPASASVTVNDNDAPAATIKAGTSPVTEGTAASFTVELSSAAPDGGLTIALTVSDASGSDFVAATDEGAKTLAFDPGDTSKTYSVATVADTVDEASGDVTVTVGAGTGYTVGTPASASVTVNDNDAPVATIKAGTSPVTEGTAASFTVELSSAAPDGGLTIALTVSDASGSDFVAATDEGAKTLAFDPGDTSKTYSVATVADTVDEAAGDVTVTVGAGTGYTVGSPSSASVTVNDNDAPVATIKAGTSPVTEGTAASFTVELSSAAPDGGLTIALTVSDASGSDFVASTNEGAKTLAFNAGDTSKIYSVATVADTVDEASGDVTVTVGTGTGYTVGTPSSASVTVNDDDSDNENRDDDPVVGAESVTVSEGAGNAELTLSLSRVSEDTPEIRGTVTPTAGTAGADDYTVDAVAFTITVSASSTTVSIPITNDTLVEGDETFTATIAITSPASGFTAGTAPTITITDDDAGVVALSLASSSVAEGGSFTANVTLQNSSGQDVTLSSDLALTVTPEFASAAAGKADAADMTDSTAKTLTITAGASMASATFATAQDTADEPDETFTFRLTSGTLAAGVTLGTAAADATITDDDATTPGPPTPLPSVNVVPTALTVGEGETATYTVSLATEPSTDVTITPSSSDPDAATFSPTSVTITVAEWSTPRTFTVYGVEDEDEDDEMSITIANTVSGYGSMTRADPVMVNVMDDRTGKPPEDPPGPPDPPPEPPVLLIEPADVTVMEGKSTSYTVTLLTPPVETLTVAPRSLDPQMVDVDALLTFEPWDWEETRTVSVRTHRDDDAYDEGTMITHLVGYYDMFGADPVTVNIMDRDTAGVTIEPAELAVGEGGAATYTVVLDSRPRETVTVTPASRDSQAADVDGPLTFTPENWNVPQAVTVITTEDDDAYDEQVEIAHAVDGYDGVTTADPVAVTVVDEDTAGVTVEPAELTVDEGAAATYTVVLDTRPAGTVTVTPEGNEKATPTPASLTFTSSDWNTAQTVTLTTEEDDDAYDEAITIAHAVAGYDDVTSGGDVNVAIVDNDTAGVTVDPVELNLTEGSAGEYTVVLDTRPAGTVTITPTSDDPDAASVASPLTFTPENWNVVQTVTVVAAHDDDAYDERATINHAVSGYDEVGTAAAVEVTVADDDTAGVIVAPTRLVVAEGGTGWYTVTLTTRPARTVTVTPASDDPDVANAGPPLVFEPENWNAVRTVPVAAAHDDDAYDERVTINHAVSGYDEVKTAEAVEVTVVDDDTAGVTIEPTELTIVEGGAGAYTIVLDTRPAGTVTVTPTSNEPAAAVSGPVTFPPEEWNKPQRVTVTVGEDAGATDELARITHAVSGYDEVVAAADVRLTLADNDLAPDPQLMTDLARALADQRVGAITRRFDQAATGTGTGAGSPSAFAQPTGSPWIQGRFPPTAGGSGPAGHYTAIGGGGGGPGHFQTSGTSRGPAWHPVDRQVLGNLNFVSPLVDCAAAGTKPADAPAGAQNCESAFSLWGRGDYRNLFGQHGDASWNGDLLTAHLGADVRLSDRWLTGLAASWTQSLLRYRNGGTDDLYELDLATIHPYARWARDTWELWATGGSGKGNMRINARSSNRSAESDVSTSTAAMGVRARVWQTAKTTLRLKGEGLRTRLEVDDTGLQGVGIGGLAVDASRLRLTVEASRSRALKSGARLSPVLELGAVHDAGDGVAGTGAELGGGLSYEASNGRLSLAGSARVLVRSDHREWGGEAAFELKPRADERGFSFALRPSYGNSRSGIQQLWEHGLQDQALQYGNDALQLEARLGYGLAAPGGPLTLLGELSSMYGSDSYRIGAEWRIKQQLAVRLVGERREHKGAPADHAIMVRAALRFR